MKFRAMAAILLSISATIMVVGTTPADAHPGGLNQQGCHNNRKTGDYHCHR